jgi:hypothetical protein
MGLYDSPPMLPPLNSPAMPAAPMLGAPPMAPSPAPAPIAPMMPSPVAPPSFGPPRQTTMPGMGKGKEAALMIAALLGGLKNPSAIGAALRGIQKGKDRKRAQWETEQQQIARKQMESAEFYSRLVENAAQFEDEIAFTDWKRAVGPVAELHGIPMESVVFSPTKKANKDRKMVQEAVDTAIRRHGPEVLNRDDVSVQLSDGRTFSMATARQMLGGDVVAGGKPVPVPGKVTPPFAATTPDEMKIAAHARALGVKPEDLTPEQIQTAVGAGKPAPAPNVPTAGTFEDYVVRYAKARNKAVTDLTDTDLEDARKRFNTADDRPITVNTGAADSRNNTRIDRVVNTFNGHPLVKEYNETQAQQGIIQSIVGGQWSGPGDMAAIFAFMKALDPGSVVRETEYENASKSGNIFTGWAARFNGALRPNGGFLSDQVRKDFLAVINARMAVKSQQYKNLRRQLAERIDRINSGAPETGDEALVDYATGAPPAQAAPPPSGTTGASYEEYLRSRERK